MNPSKTRYLIFVRPVGSLMWTQRMKECCIPYVSFSEEEAYNVACHIAENERHCAHVVNIDLKSEPDDTLKVTDSKMDTTYFLAPKTENQTN